ncbi:VOC family protein [Xanthobacter flavus]|uniref:VOC family protein n=1 Tax=Xanthobacter flavus TaxID=281 RepID=UPI001AE517E6|nr:VOC family protein [Xanthobacter flavus]MBP2149243.1 PhnB protein [Xanthobacter flavus]
MAFGPNPPPLQAHLCVRGGTEAIAFYEAAFGASCTFRQMAEDGVRVMHANVDVFGAEVMLRDEFPEFGNSLASPVSRGGASVTLNANFRSGAEVEAAFARAVRAGATVIMPPADMFWGARHARIQDPFGHVWAFNAALDPR